MDSIIRIGHLELEKNRMKTIENAGRVAEPGMLDYYFRSRPPGTVLTLTFQDPLTDLFGGKEVRGVWIKDDRTKYHFVEGTNFIELFKPEIADEAFPDEMIRPFMDYPGCCAIYPGRMLDDHIGQTHL
jgi:hypothetical protein